MAAKEQRKKKSSRGKGSSGGDSEAPTISVEVTSTPPVSPGMFCAESVGGTIVNPEALKLEQANGGEKYAKKDECAKGEQQVEDKGEEEAVEQGESVGEQAVGTAEEAEQHSLHDTPFNIKIELPSDKTIDMNVSPLELVQEIHQRLMDMRETCHRTCFLLRFGGHNMDNFVELRTIEGLTEGSTVKLIEEPYTQRKARIHLRHIRDMSNSLSQADVFSGQDLASPSFFNVLTGGDISAGAADASRSVQLDVDCTPPGFIMPTAKDTPLAGYLLETDEQHKKFLAFKSMTMSGWNPPPGPRKLQGDLMYLYVNTIEDKTYHITASTRGFFVNCSTEECFNPKRETQLGRGSHTFHSLVDLLNHISPAFKRNFALIQKIRCSRNDLERVLSPYQVYSWLAPTLDHTLDALRAEDASSFKLGYEEQIPGQTRDWNDELQSTKELPKDTLPQRVLRERAIFKVNGDFVAAATRGAMAVVDGNVLALNPGDDFRSQMFIWNNIFFSLGFDVRDHYKSVGGDSAAHAALVNDLKGVQAYFNADVDGLHTLGTVVVDYRGYRVMAQSIIPGILEKEQDQSVIYGSIDSGKTVVTHEKYLSLLDSAAMTLKVQPHEVLDSDGQPVKLCSSIECKGIIGDDNRHYILDLMRSFPPDVNFLKQDLIALPKSVQSLGFPREQKHKLAILRQELIENFVEKKYLQFVQHCASQYRNLDESERKLLSSAENSEKVEGNEQPKETGTDDQETSTTAEGESRFKSEKESSIVKNATQAVNSLKDDEFCIRFNADAFLENIVLPPSDLLNKERQLIVEAAEFLLDTQMPSLMAEVKENGAGICDGVTLTSALHTKGINVRYLGLFSKKVAENSQLEFVLRICVQEMVCRAAKHLFVTFLQTVEGHQVAQAVSHFMNCFLSAKLPQTFTAPSLVTSSSSSKNGRNKNRRGAKGSTSPTQGTPNGINAPNCEWAAVDWTIITPKVLFDLIKSEVKDYFDYVVVGDSFDDLYTHYDIGRVSMMRRFCVKCGVQMVQKNYQINSGLSCGAITEQDIISLYPIVKHIEPRATDAFRYYLSAQTKIRTGYLREGFELVAEALQLMNQVYGPIHPEIVQCVRLLARLSYIMGDNENALMYQQKAVIMSERVNGFDSPLTIQEYGSLALYSFSCGHVSTTLKVLYRMRYMMLIVTGEKHPDMATLDANIGVVLFSLRQYELALNFLESSLRLFLSFYGNTSMKTALGYHMVARVQSCLGDFRGALKNERETYAIYRNLLGDNHVKTKESSDCLRHLTQQAVTLQKQINELSGSANRSKNPNKIIPPINITPPPMSNVLELLNVINGIIFLQLRSFPNSREDFEALRAEIAKNTAQDQETAGDLMEAEEGSSEKGEHRSTNGPAAVEQTAGS